MTKHAPCACYPQGDDGDCPAPGCSAPSRSASRNSEGGALEAIESAIASFQRGELDGWELDLVRRRIVALSELTQSEPPHGLLVSIALRLDHGLFLRQDMIGETEEQHQRRIEVALSDARKAWEECTGHGFYRPEREAEYANHLGLDKRFERYTP